jgi:hypothetical protein
MHIKAADYKIVSDKARRLLVLISILINFSEMRQLNLPNGVHVRLQSEWVKYHPRHFLILVQELH